MPSRKKNTTHISRATDIGRRTWPYVLLAWERWQTLTDEEKDRYRQRAKDLAAKGRDLVNEVAAQVEQTAGKKPKRRR